MNILIVGYGNIGKHIYEEFKTLIPDIYDPNISEFSIRQNKRYDFAFVCVPTDKLPDGACDTAIVEHAVNETDAEIIVIKSTVPPETTDRLIASSGKSIVFSPEHYGVTQHCKTDPGFVILGGENNVRAKVAELYCKVKNGYYKIHFTDTNTAELSKYMLNSFLALKVTFCNEFADIAKKFGVSYPELRELFIADERVGASHTIVYLDKPYYDSHCFNKDVPALVGFADESAPLMSFVNELNISRKKNTVKMHNHENIKYYCSICLIIRDESEYLEEWLNWHIGQGVEHFYIYDHGSRQPVAEFIRSLGHGFIEKVTMVDWSGTHDNAQPDAYNDCLARFKYESKWIGFIDTDEHVRVKTGQTLPDFLKDYEEFAGLFAVWLTYDANGQRNKSDLPLRQRFQRLLQLQCGPSFIGKVFVQPPLMKDMYIHNGHPVEGFEVVNESKTVVPEMQIWTPNATTNLICVDHYFTKSYEEWMEKLKRGRCHAMFHRRYEEFFEFNPDMEYCREDVQITQEYEKSSKAVQS